MLNVNVINAKNTRKVEVKPGQAINVMVDANTRFELVDSESGKAPTQIKARRVGDNLEIVVDEKAQLEDEASSNAQAPDLVLENYYKQEDVSLFAGEGEQAVSYVPVDGAASSSYAAMNTSATTGAAVAALPLLSPWTAALAGLAVAGGGGGSTSTSSTTVTNKVPVAKDDAKSVSENGRLEGAVPSATDSDGTVVRYELVGKMADSDGILIFNANGTYKFYPSSFDYLAEGEKATVAFRYVAVYNNGAKSDPKTVTITVTGINDSPEIVAVNAAGKYDNFTVVVSENDNGVSTNSTLTIQDKDLSDFVTFKLGATKVNFEGTTFMDINPDESLDIVNFVLPLLKLQNESGKFVNEPHNLTWSFDYTDADAPFFDLIPQSETLMLNYTIEVADEHGVVKTEIVTVSIIGTNDAPKIELTADELGVDIATLNFTETPYFQGVSGTLSIYNMDLTDKSRMISTSVNVNTSKSVLSENLEAMIDRLEDVSLIQFQGSDYVSVPNLSHNYSWNFNSLNFIPEGEIVSLDYKIAINDDVTNSISDFQIINITITGINDAPLIFASQGDSLASQIKLTGPLTGGGKISVYDFDSLFGDSLSQIEITKINKNGLELNDAEFIEAKSTLKFEGDVNVSGLGNVSWNVDYSEYTPSILNLDQFDYEIQVLDSKGLAGTQHIHIGFIV